MKKNCLIRFGRIMGSSGQALVELALVMAFGSVLLMVGFGVVEFGQVIYYSIEVAGAAKAGVEYGGQSTTNANDTTGIQNAAAAAAPDLSSMQTSSSVTCRCAADNSTVTCPGTGLCASAEGVVKSSVTVNTSVTVTPPLRLRWFPASNFTLTGKATQECPQ